MPIHEKTAFKHQLTSNFTYTYIEIWRANVTQPDSIFRFYISAHMMPKNSAKVGITLDFEVAMQNPFES